MNFVFGIARVRRYGNKIRAGVFLLRVYVQSDLAGLRLSLASTPRSLFARFVFKIVKSLELMNDVGGVDIEVS